ncbi:MAG: FHA domain-containing protein, partial [Deltaproteobacteria bacterium]
MAFVPTIAEGKGRGQKFQFETDAVTIGRGAENDVVLNDAGVSRTHARIERQGAAWMLLDNGSANGTELNGAVIQKPIALRAGDRIGVGPV